MACSSCRLAEVWLLLLVFLLAAGSGASLTAYPRTQGAMAVPASQKKDDDANNGSSSSSPSSSPSPAGASNGNKQSSKEKEAKGCATTKECHMKRLVCAKKCTLAAHKKCATKCFRACSSYPICSSSSSLLHFPFP